MKVSNIFNMATRRWGFTGLVIAVMSLATLSCTEPSQEFIGQSLDVESEDNNESPAQSIQINGVTSKGPIAGAAIEIYAMDAQGAATGPLLGGATSASNGNWSITLSPLPTAALLVQSRGGVYIDEADPQLEVLNKRRVTLLATDMIEGVLPPGASAASVTILSNALLNKSRITSQSSLLDIQAVLLSNRDNAISAMGFDPFSIAAANPLSPSAGASNESILYGMYLGGLATALNSAAIILGEPVATFEIIQAMITDLSDGRLDGELNGVVIPVVGLDQNFPDNLNLNLATERFRNNNFAAYARTALGTQIAVVNELQLFSAPIIYAGADQLVAGQTQVTLTGVVVRGNGTEPVIEWSQTSGTSVSLANTLSATVNNVSSNIVSFQSPAALLAEDQDLIFLLTATDSLGNVVTSEVLVKVNALDGAVLNNPPLITSSAPLSALEDEVYIYIPSVTDADVDAVFSWSLANAPSTMLLDSATGAISWTPRQGDITSNAVTLSVSDGSDTESEIFTISVTPVNDAPVANADSFSANEDTLLALAITDLLQNDTDEEADSLTLLSYTQANSGTLTLASGVLNYTPNANFFGDDSFSYIITDGASSSAPVLVSIRVNGVNDAPVALADAISANQDTPLSFTLANLLLNDSDIDIGSGALILSTFDSVTAQGGRVSELAGSFTYTPAVGFYGVDSFTYTITDGSLSATASVSFNVAQTLVAPVVQNFTESLAVNSYVIIDVLASVTDANANESHIISYPANGVTVRAGTGDLINENGILAYVPDPGTSVFTASANYTILDSGGLSTSGTLSFSVEADTDQDGLSDTYEISLGIAGLELSADFDGDGFSDYMENKVGSDLANLSITPSINVIDASNNTISTNLKWDAGIYHIQAPVTIQAGGSLILLAGAVLKFDLGMGITVQAGGNLQAHGFMTATDAAKVNFLSVNDSSIAGNLNVFSELPAGEGDWTGLTLEAGSRLIMDEAIIKHANVAIDAEGVDVDLKGVAISQMLNAGIKCSAISANANVRMDAVSILSVDTAGTSGAGLAMLADNGNSLNMLLSNISISNTSAGAFYALAKNSAVVSGSVDLLNISNVATAIQLDSSTGASFDPQFSNVDINTTIDSQGDGSRGMGIFILGAAPNLTRFTGLNRLQGIAPTAPAIKLSGGGVNPVISGINSGGENMGGAYGLHMSAAAQASLSNIRFSGSALAGLYFDASITTAVFSDETNILLDLLPTPYELSGRVTLPPMAYANIVKGQGLFEAYARISGTFNVATTLLASPPDLSAAAIWVVAGKLIFNGVNLNINTPTSAEHVIKFYDPGSGLQFTNGGGFVAPGDPTFPIIFTSFADDAAAGDTNADFTSTGLAGDWAGIRTLNNGSVNISNAQINYATVGLSTQLNDGLAYSLTQSLSNVVINDAAINGVEIITLNEAGANPIITPNFINLSINNSGSLGANAAIWFEQAGASTIGGRISGSTINNQGGHGLYLSGGSASVLNTVFDTTNINTVLQNGVSIINSTGTGLANFAPVFIDDGDTTTNSISLSINGVAGSAVFIQGNPASPDNTAPLITFQNSTGGSVGDDTIGTISGFSVFEIYAASPVIDRLGSSNFLISGGATHNIYLAANAAGSINNIDFATGSVASLNAAIAIEDGNATALNNVFIDPGHQRGFQLIGMINPPSPLAFSSLFATAPPTEIRTIEGTLNAGGVIDNSVTPAWEISNALIVPTGQALTIDSLVSGNVTLLFSAGAGILVNSGATLTSVSSGSGHALLTSINDDNFADYQLSNAAEGSWLGVKYEQGALGGLTDVDIRFAATGLQIVDNSSNLNFYGMDIARCNIGIYLQAIAGSNNANFNATAGGRSIAQDQTSIKSCVIQHLLLDGLAGFSNDIQDLMVDGVRPLNPSPVPTASCLESADADLIVPVLNSVFSGCTQGILLNGASVLDLNNAIIRLSSVRGVEVNGSASIDIQNSAIVSNQAVLNGAGLLINSSAPQLISHNVIRNNQSLANGGGIAINTATGPVELLNNLIVQNTAQQAGGVFVETSAVTNIWNNTISDNRVFDTSVEASAGIRFNGAGTNLFEYNILSVNLNGQGAEDNIAASSILNATWNNNMLTTNTTDLNTGGINNLLAVPLLNTGGLNIIENWYLDQGLSEAVDYATKQVITLVDATLVHAGQLLNLTTDVAGGTEALSVDLDLGYHHLSPAVVVDSTIFATFEPAIEPSLAGANTFTIQLSLDLLGVPLSSADKIILNAGAALIANIRDIGQGKYLFDITSDCAATALTVTINGVQMSVNVPTYVVIPNNC